MRLGGFDNGCSNDWYFGDGKPHTHAETTYKNLETEYIYCAWLTYDQGKSDKNP